LAIAVGDHGVIRACLNVAPSMAQPGCHPAKRPSGVGIEGQRVEIGLCLLESRLASSPFCVFRCDKRANRQLSVMAVIRGSSGRSWLSIRSRRMSVDVSRIPAAAGPVAVKGSYR
jgi:hypothetical protein